MLRLRAGARRCRSSPRAALAQGGDCVVTRRRLDQARRARRPGRSRPLEDDRRGSSAVTRWPARRPPASSTPRADLFEDAHLVPDADRPHQRHAVRAPVPGGVRARRAARRRSRADLHDRLMATVSHLPHVLANVLVEPGGARARPRSRSACRRPARASVTRRAWPAPTLRCGGTSSWPTARRSSAELDALSRTRCGGARRPARRAIADALERWIEAARADRRRLLEAELAGGPVSELRVSGPEPARGSWRSWRSRSARRASTSSTWRSIRRPT